MAAEVERNHGNLLTQAKRAGLPVEQLQTTDLAEHLADRVLELEAQLAAARVVVEALPTYREDHIRMQLDIDDIIEINAAVKSVRRAVGLEG